MNEDDVNNDRTVPGMVAIPVDVVMALRDLARTLDGYAPGFGDGPPTRTYEELMLALARWRAVR